MIIKSHDLEQFESRYRAKLINSLSGFKSLNMIGSQNKNGEKNLAIFNSVFHLGAEPALIGMISRPDSVPRHTLRNIKETGYYSINSVSENLYKKAHQTSARFNRSEFETCNLESIKEENFIFVKESPLKLGVRLVRTIPIEENGTILIIGEIIYIQLADNIIKPDGYLDLEELGILSGVSLDGYYKPKLLERLPYAKA